MTLIVALPPTLREAMEPLCAERLVLCAIVTPEPADTAATVIGPDTARLLPVLTASLP